MVTLTLANSLLPTWTAVDLPMLVVLPVLIVLSAFFSGMETALFGMSRAERRTFHRGKTIADRAVTALLEDERMLLISILLGNITINVLYFVITAVLVMRSGTGVTGHAIVAVGFLLVIILFGEVGPKSVANAARTRVVTYGAPLLLSAHRLFAPLRLVLAHGIVVPLSRLTAPPADARGAHDLRALLEVSGASGVIDPEEHRILGEVIAIQRRLVRDVMTPRTRLIAVRHDADRTTIQQTVRSTRLTRLPVYEGDLDHVVGMLDVKRYLLDDSIASACDPKVLRPMEVVPEIATLEQLLTHFRRRPIQTAIVVDEYGGTEGVVSVEDVVERIVGDIATPDEMPMDPIRRIGHERWRVDARYSADDWLARFHVADDLPRVSTVGGLVLDRLGRAPEAGDTVKLTDTAGRTLTLTIAHLAGSTISSLHVERADPAPADPEAAP